MASPIDPLPQTRRRGWVPLAAVVLTALAVAVLLTVDLPINRMQRNFYSALAVIIGGLVTVGWLVLLSGLSWRLRAGLPLLAAASLFTAISGVECNGDMGPIVRWRFKKWFIDPDSALERHRSRQVRPAGLVVDLTRVTEADWPAYRGDRRDGVVRGGPALAQDWNARSPRPVWAERAIPVGGGYAAFAVAGNFLVTIEQRKGNEAVVCYHAPDGVELWKYEYPALFREQMGGDGPRATPAILGGDVYALGATGKLVCLAGATGELKWAADILANNDNLMWAMSGSPLVYDDLVVVNPGAQKAAADGRALVAYDRRTGKEVWASGDTKAGYSSPMLATIAGVRQVVLLDGECVAGYDAKAGTRLWKHDWKENSMGINVAQPIVFDDGRVFVATGYGVGSAMVKVSKAGDGWSVEEVWRNRRVMQCKFTSPVHHNGFIYGLSEGALQCIDASNGEVRWTQGDRPRGRRSDRGDYKHGQVLLAGDRLIVLTESGRLVLVEATPEGHRELGSIQGVEGDKTWNNSAVANGVLYVRNHEEMAAFDIRAD